MESLEEKKKVFQEYEELNKEIDRLTGIYVKGYENWSVQQSKEKLSEIQSKIRKRKALERQHRYLLVKEGVENV